MRKKWSEIELFFPNAHHFVGFQFFDLKLLEALDIYFYEGCFLSKRHLREKKFRKQIFLLLTFQRHIMQILLRIIAI